MIRRPPRSTQSRSSAASDVYKRQYVKPCKSWPSPPSFQRCEKISSVCKRNSKPWKLLATTNNNVGMLLNPTRPMQNDKKIGLIAGWGNFPIRVAESLVAQGYEVTCIAVKGHADPSLKNICQEYREFGMGKMGSQVRYLRKAGITQATMAGKIFKTIIFEPFFLLRHFPDLTFWRHFFPVFLTKTRDRKDDTLLNTCLLYTSPSPRDQRGSRMPSSA